MKYIDGQPMNELKTPILMKSKTRIISAEKNMMRKYLTHNILFQKIKYWHI